MIGAEPQRGPGKLALSYLTVASSGPSVGTAQHEDGPRRASDGGIASRVLDNLELEIIVVDTGARILFCNCPARQLLSASQGVFSHRGSLFFADNEANRWLRSMLLGTQQSSGRASTTLIASDEASESRLVSIDLLGSSEAVTRHLIVSFSRLTGPLPKEGIRQLMEHFKLTPAEKRLALFLSAGGQLMGAARKFRLSPHTVRNQLRSIFDKVGVRRQTELARVMCAAPQIRALA